MEVDELLRDGFLKRIPPSNERAGKSIEISERYLTAAMKNFEINVFEMAVMAAYSSSFHAARAILFHDGVAERSHFAVYEYLREKHQALGIGAINSFNLYRKLRHSVAYGLDAIIVKNDAAEALNFAKAFLVTVKHYLKSLETGPKK